MSDLAARRGGRAVEGSGLENRQAFARLEGSNPSRRANESRRLFAALPAEFHQRAALAGCSSSNQAGPRVRAFERPTPSTSSSKDFRDLGFFVELGPLDGYTIAVDCFRQRPLADSPMSVDTVSWLACGQYDRDSMIMEHSVQMPSYNAVLSRLWVDHDIGF